MNKISVGSATLRTGLQTPSGRKGAGRGELNIADGVANPVRQKGREPRPANPGRENFWPGAYNKVAENCKPVQQKFIVPFQNKISQKKL